jgi:hypothetical protein
LTISGRDHVLGGGDGKEQTRNLSSGDRLREQLADAPLLGDAGLL